MMCFEKSLFVRSLFCLVLTLQMVGAARVNHDQQESAACCMKFYPDYLVWVSHANGVGAPTNTGIRRLMNFLKHLTLKGSDDVDRLILDDELQLNVQDVLRGVRLMQGTHVKGNLPAVVTDEAEVNAMMSKIPLLFDLVHNTTEVSVLSKIPRKQCLMCLRPIDEKSVVSTLLNIGDYFDLAQATDFSESTAVQKATIRIINARLKLAEAASDGIQMSNITFDVSSNLSHAAVVDENSVLRKRDLADALIDVCKEEQANEADKVKKIVRDVAAGAYNIGKSVWKWASKAAQKAAQKAAEKAKNKNIMDQQEEKEEEKEEDEGEVDGGGEKGAQSEAKAPEPEAWKTCESDTRGLMALEALVTKFIEQAHRGMNTEFDGTTLGNVLRNRLGQLVTMASDSGSWLNLLK